MFSPHAAERGGATNVEESRARPLSGGALPRSAVHEGSKKRLSQPSRPSAPSPAI